jgi:hypothetical protein
MASQIFLNLPVKDLNKSIKFFTKLGYTFNPQFTDENATCMIISDTIYAMLLTEPFFKGFTKKEIPDTAVSNECIIALSADRREAVDAMIAKAVEAGAATPSAPQDHGFMYGHNFTDLDGHLWEYFWMDPNHIQA